MDYTSENFAIVFAAMGVRGRAVVHGKTISVSLHLALSLCQSSLAFLVLETYVFTAKVLALSLSTTHPGLSLSLSLALHHPPWSLSLHHPPWSFSHSLSPRPVFFCVCNTNPTLVDPHFTPWQFDPHQFPIHQVTCVSLSPSRYFWAPEQIPRLNVTAG